MKNTTFAHLGIMLSGFLSPSLMWRQAGRMADRGRQATGDGGTGTRWAVTVLVTVVTGSGSGKSMAWRQLLLEAGEGKAWCLWQKLWLPLPFPISKAQVGAGGGEHTFPTPYPPLLVFSSWRSSKHHLFCYMAWWCSPNITWVNRYTSSIYIYISVAVWCVSCLKQQHAFVPFSSISVYMLRNLLLKPNVSLQVFSMTEEKRLVVTGPFAASHRKRRHFILLSDFSTSVFRHVKHA